MKGGVLATRHVPGEASKQVHECSQLSRWQTHQLTLRNTSTRVCSYVRDPTRMHHAHTHTRMRIMHAHTHARARAHTHTHTLYGRRLHGARRCACAHVHTAAHVRTHAHMHKCTHMRGQVWLSLSVEEDGTAAQVRLAHAELSAAVCRPRPRVSCWVQV